MPCFRYSIHVMTINVVINVSHPCSTIRVDGETFRQHVCYKLIKLVGTPGWRIKNLFLHFWHKSLVIDRMGWCRRINSLHWRKGRNCSCRYFNVLAPIVHTKRIFDKYKFTVRALAIICNDHYFRNICISNFPYDRSYLRGQHKADKRLNALWPGSKMSSH